MRFSEVSKILGKFLFYLSIILLIPLFLSIYFQYVEMSQKPSAILAFVKTIFVCLGLSAVFLYFGRKATGNFFRRESVLLVVMIWFLTTVISSLPFWFSNTLENPIDCIFESVSGYTTTGSTIMCPKMYEINGSEKPYLMNNPLNKNSPYKFYGTITPIKDANGKIIYEGVEAVNSAILFWRSFIQWLGGLGIVLLFLTLLPALAIGGKFLLQAEMTGPIKESIAPRIKETASLLWKLYLGLTLIEVLALMLTNSNMKILDAFCITFSNLSTGGFSIRNDSIGSYHNSLTEWVVIIFMIVGSINFNLYFYCLKGKFYKLYEPDFFLFLAIVLISSIIIIANVTGTKIYSMEGSVQGAYNLADSIRESTFHAVSAQTSTGFVTTDINKWPFITQIIMILIMNLGGMSGSTAGGIKTSRLYILYKILKNKIEEILLPSIIRPIKIGDKEVPQSLAITVFSFFGLIVFFTILGTFSYISNNIDSLTAISSVSCMLNNVGFAFGAATPSVGFAFMGPFSKILSCFLMLLGRLEYFIILLVFTTTFWRSR